MVLFFDIYFYCFNFDNQINILLLNRKNETTTTIPKKPESKRNYTQKTVNNKKQQDSTRQSQILDGRARFCRVECVRELKTCVRKCERKRECKQAREQRQSMLAPAKHAKRKACKRMRGAVLREEEEEEEEETTTTTTTVRYSPTGATCAKSSQSNASDACASSSPTNSVAYALSARARSCARKCASQCRRLKTHSQTTHINMNSTHNTNANS